MLNMILDERVTLVIDKAVPITQVGHIGDLHD